MEYDIRAGDYVETKDGRVGFVVRTMDYYDGNVAFLYERHDTKDEVLVQHKYFNLPKHFNRIGVYDFIEMNKIEFIDGVDTADPNDSPYIIDKINELIKAVNDLKEQTK